VAARRAAHRLADTDRLREIYLWYCWRCGTILRTAGVCPWCRTYPGSALAVTRDPVVMAEELRGTKGWSAIPDRLSVAFPRATDPGNTYRPAAV
jgi:ribosomal protein L32